MNCSQSGRSSPYCLRRCAICSGVADASARATAGSDGTEWISRKVTTSSPRSEGTTSALRRRMKRSMSAFERDPAHLRALTNGAEAAALDPLVEALELHRVVDPDVGAVGHDLADSLFVEWRPHLLLDLATRLAQQRVDLVIL